MWSGFVSWVAFRKVQVPMDWPLPTCGPGHLGITPHERLALGRVFLGWDGRSSTQFFLVHLCKTGHVYLAHDVGQVGNPLVLDRPACLLLVIERGGVGNAR